MKLAICLTLCAFAVLRAVGQELFVFTEPASNMPTRSVAPKLTFRAPVTMEKKIKQRYTPELMFGFSKQLMVHVSSSFSDFSDSKLRWESLKLYGKWRFYSNDEVHKHFRLAAFGEGAYSRNPFIYSDINLDGDNSGLQAGLIATQLVNKLAVSATTSVIRVFDKKEEHSGNAEKTLAAVSYSVSAGYLLFPRNYTDYSQPNLNIYIEMLGMQGLDEKHYMIDLAPSLQLILNSNFKINAGYRFQLNGNMNRMAERTWLIGIERTFL